MVCTNVKSELLSFSLRYADKADRKGKSHKTWHTFVQSSPRSLVRPWPILAGLVRDYFLDRSRSSTEVTAKPLAKAKGHRRQRGIE